MEKFENYINENAMYKNKSLVILRGVPGSGKSTFANLIAGGDESIICCADDFFMHDGKYEWAREKLGQAHKECFEKCQGLLERSVPLVVVANTNVKESDFNQYIELGEKYGYTIFSVIVENRHGNNNVHNVSQDVVNAMKRKFTVSL